MKRSGLIVACVVLLGATIATGVVQGRLTNRWGIQPNVRLAVDRLQQPLPDEVGAWRVRGEDKFPAPVLEILEQPAYLSRVYEHQGTGDRITVAVIGGRQGPISVHTPEICYSSQDFSLAGVRRVTSFQDAAGTSHNLWDLPLKSNDAFGTPLRVLYAWSDGATWQATQNPRYAFLGLPHLYKIQLAVSANPASRAAGFDPGQDFLKDFLPQLQPRLVKAVRFQL